MLSEISKQVPRTVLLYKKADWDQLKQSMRDLHSELTQSDLATTSVQSMWDRFASKLEQGIDKLGSFWFTWRTLFYLLFRGFYHIGIRKDHNNTAYK